MKCRHCQSELTLEFLDLGNAPPSNAYLEKEGLKKPELTYPLRILTCTTCWLVQTEDYADADTLFNKDYAYFSSTSKSWLGHAKNYCEMITKRLGLSSNSFIVEIASNDGYLLKNFVEAKIPCLGIEPTKSTADYSAKFGIRVNKEFFGSKVGSRMAKNDEKADLIIGNNVFAHVPDINDFTAGIANLLKKHGVVTLEFPHLMQLIKYNQFDTVYHEHFSYLSLSAVNSIFKSSNLKIFDVETLPTHGGSLRVYGCKKTADHEVKETVKYILDLEENSGLKNDLTYSAFQQRANKVKDNLIRFLLDAKSDGKSVAGYGAAAKGNTLLNYAGIRKDLVSFICDASESKIGKFMPASQIPILHPSVLEEKRPDYLIIFPWNIANEVILQNKKIAKLGTKFVIAVPKLEII
jgi:SAM-dependent methyltransferase